MPPFKGKTHPNSFYRIGLMHFFSALSFPKHTSFFVLISLWGGLVFNDASAQTKSPTPVPAPVAPQVCAASDFKALAYTTNDAQLREERAKEWLGKYGKSCPLDQLELILMNQALWLGTSNTPRIISATETLYQQKKASADELEKSVDKPRGSAANKK